MQACFSLLKPYLQFLKGLASPPPPAKPDGASPSRTDALSPLLKGLASPPPPAKPDGASPSRADALSLRAESSPKIPAILVVGMGTIVLWGMLWLNGVLADQSVLFRAESQQGLRQVQGLVRFHITSPKKRLKRFAQFLDQAQISHQVQDKKGGIVKLRLTVSETELETVLERLKRDRLQLGSLDLTVGKEQHTLGISLVFE